MDAVYNNKFSYVVVYIGVRIRIGTLRIMCELGNLQENFYSLRINCLRATIFFYYAGGGCLVAHLMKSRIKKASANKYILIKALRISSSIVLVHFYGFVAGECEKYSIYFK